MSESAPKGQETAGQPFGADGEHLLNANVAPATPEQAAEERRHQAELADSSREAAETEAEATDVVEAFQAQEAAAAEPASSLITPELKQATKQRQLAQVQRRLPTRSRALSRVIHQPAVRIVSEAAAATVSRPSGLLGGGLLALVGSIGYLYLTKHIGMTYNYFIFTLLFVGGFVLGLLIELLVWSLTASRRRAQ
ncbi:MAG: hypothetical protein ABIV43_00955 [Candidatus Saccharimonadales bacterium]